MEERLHLQASRRAGKLASPGYAAYYAARLGAIGQDARKIPYAAGLQLLHAAYVYDGGKTMWLADCARLDAEAIERRAAHRAALDSAPSTESDGDYFDFADF